MALASVARRIALLVTSWRGTPTGGERAVIDSVRSRLRKAPKKGDVSELQIWLAYGFRPLVDHAIASFTVNTLRTLTDETFGEVL